LPTTINPFCQLYNALSIRHIDALSEHIEPPRYAFLAQELCCWIRNINPRNPSAWPASRATAATGGLPRGVDFAGVGRIVATRILRGGTVAMLGTPGFHHLHLNSVDPQAAIDFYTRQFPSTRKGEWGGYPALHSPNDVLILFDKVDPPPPTEPPSAIWHFGWHVADSQAVVRHFKERPEVTMRPLYTSDEGGSVLISSDTWPSVGNTLGLTKAQIAEARANGAQPLHQGGFAYMSGGPEDALFEIAGDYPQERF